MTGIALLTLILIGADGPGPRVIVTQPDESKFPEITVYFELKRPDGSFVLDAREGEFRVSEAGRDRPILRFEAPESIRARPTTVVLVVDRSGSMDKEGRLDGLKRAVATFLGGMPEGSRVAVVAFSTEVELACPFTADKARALAAVDALEASGATRYYDAVASALDLLAVQKGRRAVLALTDGLDAKSLDYTLAQVSAKARALNLPVYTLGLGDEREIAVDDLARLAEGSRGQHYLAQDAGELRSVYEEIARGLGSTYSLTYATDRRVPDGTLRPIRVDYRAGAAAVASAGETAVFIRGMVVRQSGWSRLFLALLAALGLLAILPARLRRRPAEAP